MVLLRGSLEPILSPADTEFKYSREADQLQVTRFTTVRYKSIDVMRPSYCQSNLIKASEIFAVEKCVDSSLLPSSTCNFLIICHEEDACDYLIVGQNYEFTV